MFASAFLLSAITLVAGGKSDYRIVRPDKASPAIVEWAKFLSTTIREMTGVEIPVVGESERKADEPAILFAVRPEGDRYEEYVVRTDGKDLVLTGTGARGPALAARHFLTRVCGCRWYDGWTRKVPKTDTLAVPDLDVRRTPSFLVRTIFMGCGWGNDPKWRPGPVSMPRLPGNPTGRPGDAHTFYAFTKDFPKERLDLLSLSPEGKRCMLKGALGPNFCLTHPDARAHVKAKLREFIRLDRADAARDGIEPPFIYSLCQNDCSKFFCCCPACKAISDKYGHGGLLIDFVNDIARDIAKDHPEIVLSTDAYAFSEEPPKGGPKAEPNVLVEVTRTKQNYYSPVEEDTDNPYVGFLKGWSQAASLLGSWDYWVFYWDTFPAPYHNVHFIRRNLKWYHDLGVRMAHIESEQPNTASFRSLKAWLGDELLLDIDQDDAPLIDDFLSGFYGAAAPEMRELMDLIAERQKGQNGKVFVKEGVFHPSMGVDVPRRAWLDAGFYAKAEDIFTRAEAKVKDADRQTRLNVARERIPVDLSLLYVYGIIRPSVAKEALAKRYLANREAQYRLRVDEKILGSELAKVRREVDRIFGIEEEKKSAPAASAAASEREHDPRVEKRLADGGVELSFDLTRLTVVPKEKGVSVEWFCRESEMGNIHSRYDAGDWNLFSGDAVDFYFSPYLPDASAGMQPCQYRFMMNPSGTTLTAYDDAKWRSRSIVAKRTFVDGGWKSEWMIPYAALAAYDSRTKDGFRPVLPTAHWLFSVSRARAATGVKELLPGGEVRLEIPGKFLEPFARLAIGRCTATAGKKTGEYEIACPAAEIAGRPFEGRAKILLYVGKARTVVATETLKLAAGATGEIRATVVLPQSAERFAASVAVADEENRCVRVSPDLPIANPWVE